MPVYGLPWYICLIAGVLIAAAVGGISGALKAYLNVNEVISCIMLNWISLYSVNMLLSQVKDGSTPYTKLLFSYNKSAMLPTAGLNELFHNKYMTIGVPMAVIAAIIVWVVLQKSEQFSPPTLSSILPVVVLMWIQQHTVHRFLI